MDENGQEKKHKGQSEGKIEFINSTVKPPQYARDILLISSEFNVFVIKS